MLDLANTIISYLIKDVNLNMGITELFVNAIKIIVFIVPFIILGFIVRYFWKKYFDEPHIVNNTTNNYYEKNYKEKGKESK